jgi:hypothetical protein
MSREGMSVETAVRGLMIATPKLARLLVWALFMVIHLFLLVVCYFCCGGFSSLRVNSKCGRRRSSRIHHCRNIGLASSARPDLY